MTYTVTDFSGNELQVGDSVMVTAAVGPFKVPVRFQARTFEIVRIDSRPDTLDREISNAKLVLRDAARDGLTIPAYYVVKA